MENLKLGPQWTVGWFNTLSLHIAYVKLLSDAAVTGLHQNSFQDFS